MAAAGGGTLITAGDRELPGSMQGQGTPRTTWWPTFSDCGQPLKVFKSFRNSSTSWGPRLLHMCLWQTLHIKPQLFLPYGCRQSKGFGDVSWTVSSSFPGLSDIGHLFPSPLLHCPKLLPQTWISALPLWGSGGTRVQTWKQSRCRSPPNTGFKYYISNFHLLLRIYDQQVSGKQSEGASQSATPQIFGWELGTSIYIPKKYGYFQGILQLSGEEYTTNIQSTIRGLFVADGI